MTTRQLTLLALPDVFAVCRLDPDAPVPPWAFDAGFSSITRTAEELSIVCPEDRVPEGVDCEKNWRCLRVAGSIEFSVIGVLASLVSPLAKQGISVFAISTFDTDYLLVKDTDLSKARSALRQAGHDMEAVYET